MIVNILVITNFIIIYQVNNMEGRQNAVIRYNCSFSTTNAPKHARQVSNLTRLSSDTFDKEEFISTHEEMQSVHYRRPSMDLSLCLEENELEREYKMLVSSVQSLLERGCVMTRHERIRINQWMVKLTARQNNLVWKKNVNFYLKILREMMVQGKFGEPFVSLPTDGPLPKLTIYDVPYPIRESLNQSKEKHRSKNKCKAGISRENKQNQSRISKDSNVLVQASNSYMKSVKNVKKISNVARSQMNYADQYPQVDMVMAAKPVFSTHKTRRENVLKSNPNSTKISGNKNLNKIGKTASMQTYNDQNKENDPNSININRQLFKSKEKVTNSTLQTQYIKTDHYESKKSNQYKEQQTNHLYSFSSSEQNEQLCKQKYSVLFKVFKMLRENQETLGLKPNYESLMIELLDLGKKLDLNLLQTDFDKEDSTLSQESKALIRASEDIRTKFKQTDNETLQFMNFLQGLREKV